MEGQLPSWPVWQLTLRPLAASMPAPVQGGTECVQPCVLGRDPVPTQRHPSGAPHVPRRWGGPGHGEYWGITVPRESPLNPESEAGSPACPPGYWPCNAIMTFLHLQCFLTRGNSIVSCWCFGSWCHLLVCGVPLCPQDGPVPAASWQSITACVPRMSPSMLLPSKALLCVPIFPHDVPIGVAALQSTAVYRSPQAVPLCCFPAEYYVVCLCPPQEVPIPVAALLSTVVSLQDLPICVASWKSTTVCPWGKPWPASPQAAAAGHPWGDGPEHSPLGTGKDERGWQSCRVETELAAVGSLGARWHGDTSPPQQGHPSWGSLCGFIPGQGICIQAAWLMGAAPGRGSGWVLQGAGAASGMCHSVPMPAGGSLGPHGQGPHGQDPTGCISAFLFLILLFSYRSTYLRMMVIEAFIKG